MRAILRRLCAWAYQKLKPRIDVNTLKAELAAYQRVLAAMPVQERAQFTRFLASPPR